MKRLKRKTKKSHKSRSTDGIDEQNAINNESHTPQSERSEAAESTSMISSPGEPITSYPPQPIEDDNLWKKSVEPEIRGREEEFDDYLADLLL